MVSSVARMTPAVRMELEPGGVLQMVEKVQRWDMGKPQEPEMNRVFGCFWMFFSVIWAGVCVLYVGY